MPGNEAYLISEFNTQMTGHYDSDGMAKNITPAREGESMDMQTNAVADRLETAAALLERTLGMLEERHRDLSGEVERISATVETTRREEELAEKLEAVERELAELKAARFEAQGEARLNAQAHALPKALEPLRRTLPSSTAEMLAKHGVGESAVDVRTLDAALSGLSLEQRIAVKSQLRRAGAMA